jgi:hypothetical protein
MAKEKPTIEITHTINRDIPMFRKKNEQAFIDIKISISTDSLFYSDVRHREFIDEIRKLAERFT